MPEPLRPHMPVDDVGRLGAAEEEAGVQSATMSTHSADNSGEQHLKLPVEELLKRARPLPPHEEMVIEDLSDEEAQAFFDAVNS